MENQRWNPAYLARYISTNLIPSTGFVVIPAAFLSVVIRYPGWREKQKPCAHKVLHTNVRSTNCKAGMATGPSTGEPLNQVWDAQKRDAAQEYRGRKGLLEQSSVKQTRQETAACVSIGNAQERQVYRDKNHISSCWRLGGQKWGLLVAQGVLMGVMEMAQPELWSWLHTR